jgi:cytochrome c oxidase cbb3-type subunit 4
MGTLSGIGTAVLLIAFIALVVWAWSPRQKRRWEESARLPLEDDPPAERKKEQGHE